LAAAVGVLLGAELLWAGAGWSAPAARASAPWSAPVVLAGCAGGPVRVAFPSSSPFAASGPGAIAFVSGAGGCGGGRGGAKVAVSALGAGDRPGLPVAVTLSGAGALTGSDSLVGATDGDIVIAGGATGTGPGGGVVAEGRAGDAPARAYSLGGPVAPVAETSAYLGDVGIASLRGQGSGRSIVLRVQRHFATVPGPAVTVAPWPGALTGLAVGLDYRTDAVVAWASGGGLYARWVRAGGRLGPIQRLAGVAPAPRISVTISDDNRAIIAWVDQPAGSDGVTTGSVYANISAPGVRFGRGRLIESFREPPGVSLDDGAVRLTRRARESVTMAWTGMAGGHYAVRAAPVSLTGVGQPLTLSAAGQDSLLADLVPGPHDEVLALWSAAPRTAGGLDRGNVEIVASRGSAGGAFGPPEVVAPPGALTQPAVAVDPATDQAVAAWRVGGPRPSVAYAVRAAG
jgi:hypothetical protein